MLLLYYYYMICVLLLGKTSVILRRILLHMRPHATTTIVLYACSPTSRIGSRALLQLQKKKELVEGEYSYYRTPASYINYYYYYVCGTGAGGGVSLELLLRL